MRVAKVVLMLGLTGCVAVSTPASVPSSSGVLSAGTAVGGSEAAGGSEGAGLVVDVSDLRDADGVVRVSVFASEEGFLKDDSKAVARGVIRAGAECRKLSFRLKPGRYAVAVLHDENDNGKLDTNFLGIPTEGYGVTNNPKPRFRAPKFKEAVIEVPEGGKAAVVSLQYL